MVIATAVTSSPRGVGNVSYLGNTLTSIVEAGFIHPEVFYDGADKFVDPYLMCQYDFHTTTRKLGPYGNWLRAMKYLVNMEPQAQWYAIFQDDIVVAKNTHDWFLEEFPKLCVDEYLGCVSLYTSKVNQQPLSGWYTLEDCPQNGKDSPLWARAQGACAMVMPRLAAIEFLKRRVRIGSRNGPELRVAEFCVDSGIKYYTHTPSLVEHTGKVSSIGEYNIARFTEGTRSAGCWISDTHLLQHGC